LEHDIRQPTTCMNGHDNVSRQNLDAIHRTCNEREPAGQPWPTFNERLVQRGGRRWHRGVDRQRARRRVIEDQHQLREEAVTRGEIDDAAAAKEPAYTARGLPCFIQLFAWKAPGMADGAADAIEECFTWKARTISIGEAPTRRAGEAHGQKLSERSRRLFHRPIFEIHNPVGCRADEFSDKGARDIVLLNRPEPARNQTPKPGRIARRVDVAADDAWPKDRQAFEAYRLNRFFFQAHHPRIANPALYVASDCGEQRKPRDPSGVTPTGKATDHPDFESLQLLLAPLQTALADANTGRSIDRVALRHRPAPASSRLLESE